MRLVELVIDSEDDEERWRLREEFLREHRVRGVDWRAFTEEVLENVDEQVETFGLQVVQHDHGGDYYEWHIERRAHENEEEYEAPEQSKQHHCDCVVNWKAYADEVLEKVDQQLEKLGLEVVQHFHGGDYFDWHIDERLPGNNAPPKESPEAEEFRQWYVEMRGGQAAVDSGRGRGKEHLEGWRKRRRVYLDALKATPSGGCNDDEYHDI